MSPLFEKPWGTDFKDQWNVGASATTTGERSAHRGDYLENR